MTVVREGGAKRVGLASQQDKISDLLRALRSVGGYLEPPSAVKAECWTWRSIVALAILANLVAWLYQPVLVNLVREWWNDENYSHGFLIPLLSAYFVWERRERLRRLAVTPSSLGLGLLVAGLGLLLLGNVAGELFTMRMSLLGVLAGLVLYLLGREHLKALAFPILYLLFMIPPPAIVFNAIAFPLQLFAARTATATLQVMDIPVLREGNLIILANSALEVNEACSGIRSLITLLALATTFAYFTLRDRWRQVALVISAIPIAVVTNASRVAGTGLLAHFYGDQVAREFFHTFSGWLVFLLAAILLGAEGVLLSRLFRQKRRDPGTMPRVSVEKEHPGQLPEPEGGGLRAWRRVGTATAVLVGGIVSLLMLSHGEAVPLRRALEEFPLQVAQWRGIREALPPSTLNVLQVTDYMMRLYASPGRPPIWLYVGYYESQRQGQIIHSPRNCLPGSGWNILKHEYLTLRLSDHADPVTINQVLVGKEEERQIVLYWYQERGRTIANEYAAKLYLVTDTIMRNRTDGALVRLSAPVKGSEEKTVQQLLEFTSLIFPTLAEFLPG